MVEHKTSQSVMSSVVFPIIMIICSLVNGKIDGLRENHVPSQLTRQRSKLSQRSGQPQDGPKFYANWMGYENEHFDRMLYDNETSVENRTKLDDDRDYYDDDDHYDDNDHVTWTEAYASTKDDYLTGDDYEGGGNKWTEIEADQGNEHRSTIINRVEQYKAAAEAKAWEFFDSAPSEWSSAQWDLIFTLIGLTLVTCCLAVACCVFCCFEHVVDDPMKQYRYKERFRRYRSHRDRYDDDHYKRYADYDDSTTVGSESHCDPTSPVSAASENPNTSESENVSSRKNRRQSSELRRNDRKIRWGLGSKKKITSNTTLRPADFVDEISLFPTLTP